MKIPLDAVPAPVVVLDTAAMILDLNDRAVDVLGADRDALIGQPIRAVLSRPERVIGEDRRQSEWEIEGRTYLAIEDPAAVAGRRACLLVDVTELASARDEAREIARARSGFLGKVSHEIRSAVASMIGFAEVLEVEVSETNRELSRVITRSGRHLIDTLNAVMDLAQVEFGGREVEMTDFDIIRRVRDRVTILRPDAERKRLKLTFEADEESLSARLNPIFLDRILHNLIDNAVKYTDEGRVEVTAEGRDGRVWIYVADTGRGMDAAFIPRLFAPFERERRDDDSNVGTGLGLAVTRYLVELMDGRIAACSTLDEGSTFTVSFPVQS